MYFCARAVLLLLSTLVRLAVGLALGVVLASVLVPPAVARVEGQTGVSSLLTPLTRVLETGSQEPQAAGASLRDGLSRLTQLASSAEVGFESAPPSG